MTSHLQQAMRLHPVALASALLALPLLSHAATPDAGSLLRQLQPADDARLSQPAALPKLQIRKDDGVELVDRTPFALVRIDFSGHTRVGADELQQLAAGMTGRDVTLVELDALARRITALYRSKGYPLARAIVPAQTIQGGVVRIEVYEARLGAVQLRNRSEVADAAVLRQVSGLKPGEPVSDAALERALLLVSDLPAARYEAVLAPGSAVGTTDLELDMQPTRPYDASVGADNFGSGATGRYRAKGAYTRYNVLKQGDAIDIGGVTSGSGMAYLRAGIDSALPLEAARGGASYSHLKYTLGDTLKPLGGHGTANQATAWASYALTRSVASSSYLRLQVDSVALRDDLDSAGVRNHRNIDIVGAEFSGNLRTDNLLAWWSVAANQGRLRFSDDNARATDASTAGSAGSYTRVNLSANTLHTVAGGQLQLTATAQLADKNLDSSQKMQLGGAASMRAFKSSAVSADTGAVLGVEYRRALADASYGRWQWNAFAEAARVRASVNPWSSTSANRISMNDVGVGLTLEAKDQWVVRATAASAVGRPAVAGIDRSVKAWLEISRRM